MLNTETAAAAPITESATGALPHILALLNIARDKRDVGDADAQVVELEARERIERLIAAPVVPLLGQPWPGVDGVFAGITTNAEGRTYALVLLNERAPKRLTWRKGIEWANTVGGELPDRAESLLLFCNLPGHFDTSAWHWTGTQYSDGTAWDQIFNNGNQSTLGKSYEAACRAVRRFDVQSFNPSV